MCWLKYIQLKTSKSRKKLCLFIAKPKQRSDHVFIKKSGKSPHPSGCMLCQQHHLSLEAAEIFPRSTGYKRICLNYNLFLCFWSNMSIFLSKHIELVSFCRAQLSLVKLLACHTWLTVTSQPGKASCMFHNETPLPEHFTPSCMHIFKDICQYKYL